jgi:hypothetical protein
MYVVMIAENGLVVSSAEIPDWAEPNEGFVEVSAEEYAQAVVGATRNQDGSYTPPDPPEQPLSPADLVLLFTPQELFAIDQARQVDAEVFYAWTLGQSSQPVYRSHPLFQSYLGVLVTKELLTAPRAARIAQGLRPE